MPAADGEGAARRLGLSSRDRRTENREGEPAKSGRAGEGEHVVHYGAWGVPEVEAGVHWEGGGARTAAVDGQARATCRLHLITTRLMSCREWPGARMYFNPRNALDYEKR